MSINVLSKMMGVGILLIGVLFAWEAFVLAGFQVVGSTFIPIIEPYQGKPKFEALLLLLMWPLPVLVVFAYPAVYLLKNRNVRNLLLVLTYLGCLLMSTEIMLFVRRKLLGF